MKVHYLYRTIVFAGCIMLASNSFAAGRIVIQPKALMGFQNNSNFWLAEDQEVSVNTNSVKPGLVFGFETPKTNVALDATVDLYWYDDQDTPPDGVSDASDDDYVGFTGEFGADHQLTDRLNIGLTDELYVTRDPARADASSNSISRDKYTINYFEPKVYYELDDKFGIQAKYRNTFTDYEKDLEDSKEHRGIFDLYYNLNRSSAVFLDYQVWARDYDQDSTAYTSNLVTLNYEKQFNYFTIKGGAGYHHRSFDVDTIEDLDMFSWKVEISGQDLESTLATTKSRVSLNFGQEMNDDGTGDSYFKATFVELEAGYRLFEKLELSGTGGFQNSKYETDPRDEDTYLISVRLAYQALEFLTVGVKGGYETRDSNVDGNGYDDRFILLSLDLAYDLGSR